MIPGLVEIVECEFCGAGRLAFLMMRAGKTPVLKYVAPPTCA